MQEYFNTSSAPPARKAKTPPSHPPTTLQQQPPITTHETSAVVPIAPVDPTPSEHASSFLEKITPAIDDVTLAPTADDVTLKAAVTTTGEESVAVVTVSSE